MDIESGWPIDFTAPEAYERYIVPAWMEEWAGALIERAGIRSGDRVLDVACGTGIVARRAARLAGPDGIVAGLDADKGMLCAAERFAEREGLASIEWRHGDAASVPCGTAEYDVVLCQHGLQFFPDKSKALREMLRVTAPGGRLAICVWRSLDRCPFLAIVAGAIGRHLGDRYTPAFHASCSLSDREEIRSLLTGAGFQDVQVRLEVRTARFPFLEELLAGYMSVFPFGREVAAMPPIERQKMFDDITKSLQIFTDDDGLAVPMECHIATARK